MTDEIRTKYDWWGQNKKILPNNGLYKSNHHRYLQIAHSVQILDRKIVLSIPMMGYHSEFLCWFQNQILLNGLSHEQ